MYKDNNHTPLKYLMVLCLAVVVWWHSVANAQSEPIRASEQRSLLELYQMAIKNDTRYQASLANFEATSLANYQSAVRDCCRSFRLERIARKSTMRKARGGFNPLRRD